MKRTTIAGGAIATLLVLLGLAFAARQRVPGTGAVPRAPAPLSTGAATVPSAPTGPVESDPGFLHGRIATLGGATYEGRLRWGKNEEAFWGDYFNGRRNENRWAHFVPAEQLPTESRPIEVFGVPIGHRERQVDLGRPFLARFGDIARIEARGKLVRVTLKSGTACDLDRLEASDFDDDVRVWDATRGTLDLDPRGIRAIAFLPAGGPGGISSRLHGTVRTRRGTFTGFVQWDREKGVGSDELEGRTAAGSLVLRFDTIRSIARHAPDGALVTLRDGREFAVAGTRDSGHGNRGMYVDDARYGRVLISWDAFERVDFTPGGDGPAYGDFPPGRPLAGRVTTRDGRRLAGRIVYDLDESETTETLDAPAGGVDYTIPFALVASIVPSVHDQSGAPRARVTLRTGEVLDLERAGDLGEKNAGLLVFVEGRERPEYVRWIDVERVDLEHPATDPTAERRPGP